MTSPRPTRGRPPRTEVQRAEQRRRLLASVVEAIRQHGPDVNVGEMADIAGVSKPVLYSEFGDKRGIAEAVAVDVAAQVERELINRLSTSDGVNAHSVITAIVEVLVDLITNEPSTYTFVVHSLRDADHSFLDKALVRVIHERAALLFSLIRGPLDPDEVDIVIDAAFGMVLGALESWQPTQRVPRDRLVQQLAGAIEAGLASLATDPL